jgi:hypothetical protein
MVMYIFFSHSQYCFIQLNSLQIKTNGNLCLFGNFLHTIKVINTQEPLLLKFL